ncbi:hypothetical protein [Laribacter hongkongensis]|uniref:Uncharacterized protein n=3 Tax=Laribacter hongkongensis TaxID=168471 RepID=A0A248LFX8_9NEIS|nr:hypothetical protein [Laribacter hongkongensis]ASJ23552.1 hypothetical protein LHGZ1_0721 [Laribacter hongkongensis]MBE5530067.1 hypothetical protein [Laribacter hongkongensis]MCG8992007.1 hypothetical protein [Laribacter hongkongensis]MCG8997900.1 hypothetical protein [Laribacter hongkongensis]MCG9000959.1 hypothetical protein [Laribacter hongkongensis]
MSMLLPDPRLLPRVAPKNEIIRAVLARLAETDAAAIDRKQAALEGLLRDALDMDDAQALTVALQLAPEQTACRHLWHTLLDVLGAGAAERHAVVFALPLVLATGSRKETQLPARIDAGPVLAILREQGVIRESAQVWLGGELLHPDTLAGLSFGQLWQCSQSAGLEGLPQTLAGTPVPVHEEGVFVRYLLGVALQEAGQPAPVRLGGMVGDWGMLVMRNLTAQLETPKVTLFPIPAVPNLVPEALRQGLALRLDVNLQMWASNIIRKLRKGGVEIVGVAAAHENNEIRFTVSSPGDDKNWSGFVWPLAPLDSVERIGENFRALMSECQVSDVRVLADIQPDRVDGVPFLVTCNDAAARPA